MTYPAATASRNKTDGAALRTPPQSPDMERALLGALLLDGSAFGQVSDLLDDSSFYRPVHGVVFSAMRALDTRHEPIDVITVTEQLRSMNRLEEIGGGLALTDIADAVPSAANIEYYARVVHEKSILRKLISDCTEASTSAYDPSARADEVFEKLQSRLVQLVGERRGRHAVESRKVLHDTMEYISKLKSTKGQLTGVGSGFDLLDYYTTGFSPGELVIIAARPSMGKTSLAMNIARAASGKYGVPVAVFSLEMEVRQLMLRMLSGEAHIPLMRLRGTAHMNNEQYLRLSEAAGRLAELPIYFDDSAGLGIDMIRARCRQLWMEHKIGLIVIDYLQLITPPKMADNQQQWIAFVSASLKSLAKELSIPIICLSQLSRAPETRGGDRKPMLSDLRDSGAIEQDADVVMFVYRPWVYKDQTKSKKHEIGNREYDITENLAELIIAKNRNGPTGSIPLSFLGEYTMFASFAEDDMPPVEAAAVTAGDDDESDVEPGEVPF